MEVREAQEEKLCRTAIYSPRARDCSPASSTEGDARALLSQLAGKASGKVGALVVS